MILYRTFAWIPKWVDGRLPDDVHINVGAMDDDYVSEGWLA